ncbi:hypothetical protein BJX99DRAFT_262481 [Aspergillus californicus]
MDQQGDRALPSHELHLPALDGDLVSRRRRLGYPEDEGVVPHAPALQALDRRPMLGRQGHPGQTIRSTSLEADPGRDSRITRICGPHSLHPRLNIRLNSIRLPLGDYQPLHLDSYYAAPNTGTDPRVVATSYRRKRSTTYTPPTAAELALIHPAQRDLYRENHELDFATKQSLTSLPDWSGCTTFETMCDKCKRLYGKINPHVSPLYRQCPASTTTYIVDGTYIGTKVKAIDIVEKFSAQIQLNAKRDTPVHAAVRRSAGSSYSAGNWYDVTSLPSETRHVDSSPSLLEQVFYWHWMKQQKRKDEAADAKRSKKREISILVDLHFWPDEDYDTFFLRAINEVVENIQTEVFEMHCSLHRLRWWKDTHPVAGRRRRGESEAEWRERLSRTPST